MRSAVLLLFLVQEAIGSAPIYSTYFSPISFPAGAAVDKEGNLYLVGTTSVDSLPVTPGVVQPKFGGGTCFGSGFFGGPTPFSCNDLYIAKFDPSGTQMLWATYLGGSGFDQAGAIAADASGNVYVTGYTASTDFPTPPGSPQNQRPSAFITKLNSTGTALVYTFFLPSGGVPPTPSAIAVDAAGNVYLAGTANSPQLSTTPGVVQPSMGGGATDAFVAKLAANGTDLLYLTFLGGGADDRATAIAADADGNAYVAGATSSPDFPVTSAAAQSALAGATDAFVAKLDPAGQSLVYATFLGGQAQEEASGIALDSARNALVVGRTFSTDFLGNAQNPAGGYVVVLAADGSAVVNALFLGTNANGIAMDPGGLANITGTAAPSLPATPDAPQCCLNGQADAFFARWDPQSSQIRYATYIGGSGDEAGRAVTVDPAGNAYVAGTTTSTDFPTTQGSLQPARSAPQGFMVTFVAAFASSR